MGIVRPPWITEEWFTKCPFNYCDHFGDREVLATVCKICKDEIQREKLYKKAGKDPHDLKYAFQDIAYNLAYTMRMVQKKAEEMGINLDEMPDPEEAPPAETYPIFNLVRKYGDQVEKVIKNLDVVPIDADKNLVIKACNVFAHSRSYVIAKTGRALSSKWEEEKDPEDDLDDSKTSALLAYLAIERNSRAALALSKHKPLIYLKEKNLKFAALSIDMAEMIKGEFFPDEKLEYEEVGCDSYNKIFK